MGKYMMGLQLLIIGMGTVLLSLYFLSLFLRLSGHFLGTDSVKRDKNIKKNKKRAVDKDNDSDIAESSQFNDIRTDGKKAAAITAAVYQYLDDSSRYRIISIKKQDNRWKS